MISAKVIIKNDFTNLVKDLQFYVNRKLFNKAQDLSRQTKNEVKSMIYKTSGLDRKTGALKNSVQEVPMKQKGNSFIAGVTIGDENTPHLKTHVGKRGTSKHIVHKNSKFLTIPIKGGPAYRARNKDKTVAELGGISNFTCITVHGNKFMILRKNRSNRGEKPTFVYLLKKSINVPRRIFPEEIKAKVLPKLQQTVIDTWKYYINRYLQGKEIR